jgi:hypothetical protein
MVFVAISGVPVRINEDARPHDLELPYAPRGLFASHI